MAGKQDCRSFLDYRRASRNPEPFDAEVQMINVKNKHIAVIGAARSGLAVAVLLKKRGADVFVSDVSGIRKEAKSELDTRGIRWEEGRHSDMVKKADLAVVSPGVPDHAPIMSYYKEAKIPVFS